MSIVFAGVVGYLPARIIPPPPRARWTAPVADAVTPITRALAEIARALRAPAPALPDRLSAESVADGSWAVAVLDAARALDERLSDELGRPNRAVNGEPIGAWVASPLKAIDGAVKALDAYVRRVQDAERGERPEPPSAEGRAWRELKDRHAAELAEMKARHDAERAEFARLRKMSTRTNVMEVAG
ncbi:hypothetical protein [Nocardia cyriacigeorgica]|uniref:hypothetical protein n=1 Tax=Nocardia cyriacigeorgica TaxID=135487 RepID=UPI0024538D7D|nr:hypothetical protein [Nocardia cyriacigeorgica]